MRKNKLLERLRAGQPSFGMWLTIGSSVIAEEAAHAGFDWVALDIQHGYWTDDQVLAAIQVISNTASVPVARLPANDPAVIGRFLDAGALGVIVPLVNTAEEAARAVAAGRYPPQGKRSAGGSRLLLYGSDYFAAANTEIFIAVMIETQQAVNQIDSILAVPGVDCVFLGPSDLALDMGTFGQASPAHEQAIQTVLAAGKRHGIPVGIPCGSVEAARRRAAQGFQFMDCGSDYGFLSRGLREAKAGVGEYDSTAQ